MESNNVSVGITAVLGEFIYNANVWKAPLPPTWKICHFSCKICFKLAEDPVVNVICNHLFCWRCIYLLLSSSSCEPQQHGSRRGCPFCKSHLDVSPSASTIFPVCSGPKPGADFAVIDMHNTGEEEEAEERLKESIVKEGKQYVLNRPLWEGKAIHVSKHDFIMKMMLKFLDEREAWKCHWPIIVSLASDLDQLPFQTSNCASYIKYVSRDLNKMIKVLKDGWEWLNGEKYADKQSDLESCINSKKTGDYELHFALVPDETKFPGVSTFACRICKQIAYEPVANACRHLFCWTCLQNTGDGTSCCPVCDWRIIFYASRDSLNPIYCTIGEPKEEDDYLKSNRHNFVAVKRHLPSRNDQTVVVPFFRYMINRIVEDVQVTLRLFDNLRSNMSHEHIEEIVSAGTAVWDKLHVDLVKQWRVDSGEQIDECLIIPAFLLHEIRETEDGSISVCVDIFRDTPDAC